MHCNPDGAPLKILNRCVCVSSWSNETVSRAIRSTVPADASDPEPRQFTPWLGESSGEKAGGRGEADSVGSSAGYVLSNLCTLLLSAGTPYCQEIIILDAIKSSKLPSDY